MTFETSIFGKNENDLILEAKQGSEKAFAELVRRHKEKAIQVAYVALGNYEDAKDVSQEAFVKAFYALKHFQMKSKFFTWFYRILMNAATDFLRRKKGMRLENGNSQEEAGGFFDLLADEKASPEKDLLNAELQSQITQAIQKLPLKQRMIFTLRFIEGLPLAEIAKISQVAEGTVKASLHFAIQKFKQELLPYVPALKEA